MKAIVESVALVIGGVVILAACMTIPSLLTMWAVNTLCGPVIPYTFWNWLAVLWLGMAVRGIRTGGGKEKCES